MRTACECGCGGAAPISKRTDSRRGAVKGQPTRYIKGHHRRISFAPPCGYVVDTESGCWLWMLKRDRAGYGRGKFAGRDVYAHIAMYERCFGPVPPGLELDHLCRNPQCCNPDHLEAVTPTENKRRSAATKLTISSVSFIRESSLTNKELAEMFKVDPSNISHIRARRSWSEVEAV